MKVILALELGLRVSYLYNSNNLLNLILLVISAFCLFEHLYPGIMSYA